MNNIILNDKIQYKDNITISGMLLQSKYQTVDYHIYILFNCKKHREIMVASNVNKFRQFTELLWIFNLLINHHGLVCYHVPLYLLFSRIVYVCSCLWGPQKQIPKLPNNKRHVAIDQGDIC